jgi:subtilisin family serine protease
VSERGDTARLAPVPAWAEAFLPERLRAAPALDLPAALTPDWAFGDRSGAGAKVAVIDSGIDGDHPWVGGVTGGAVLRLDVDADEVVVTDGVHEDLYGHGTACAGIIRRLAPGAEIYSVRVLGERLTGKARVVVSGIEWCLEHGMNVVNLSLSTTNEDWYDRFQDLCDQAARKRVMLVSALANERKTSYPSEFSGVFSVAATRDDDLERWYSNPEPPAEWGAPGIDVEVAWLGGSTLVATGNSFAAPVIAGHLARLVAAHPGITTWQAKTVLAQLAVNGKARADGDHPARVPADRPESAAPPGG